MKQVCLFDAVFLNLSFFVCVTQEMLELWEILILNQRERTTWEARCKGKVMLKQNEKHGARRCQLYLPADKGAQSHACMKKVVNLLDFTEAGNLLSDKPA